MNAKVSKWGKCLGFRIPAEVARQLGIKEGERLSIEVTPKGMLISKSDNALDQLLSGVTDDNRHGETDWGTDVGLENI